MHETFNRLSYLPNAISRIALDIDELAAAESAEAADLQTRRAPGDPADTALQGPVPPDDPERR